MPWGFSSLSIRRFCHACGNELVDSIVHFGEKRDLVRPQNWAKAGEHANEAELIICMGSSLKVLKSYHCLWGMERVKSKRPKLCIINLQWTPKDKLATLKINGENFFRFRMGYLEMIAKFLTLLCCLNHILDPRFTPRCP